MKTLGDLFNYMKTKNQSFELFGAKKEFLTEYHNRLKTLGSAILEENNISTPEELSTLPMETTLGQKSTNIFSDLKKWVKENEW